MLCAFVPVRTQGRNVVPDVKATIRYGRHVLFVGGFARQSGRGCTTGRVPRWRFLFQSMYMTFVCLLRVPA